MAEKSITQPGAVCAVGVDNQKRERLERGRRLALSYLG